RAAAVRGHGLAERLRQEEQRAAVHVERPVPAAFVDLEQRLQHARRRVAHDDRGRAELLDQALGDGPNLVGVPEVALQDGGPPAELLDLRGGLLGALAVAEVLDADVGALHRQLQRDGPADAARGAGDERDTPGDAAQPDAAGAGEIRVAHVTPPAAGPETRSARRTRTSSTWPRRPPRRGPRSARRPGRRPGRVPPG